ncbi:putative serine hydrolase [Oratosquilla oratoria]|uniref:putative serine hydrolase n=1 Tax=Oratosquilla oratoria TaxID=337810 RepID=UPI003F75E20E
MAEVINGEQLTNGHTSTWEEVEIDIGWGVLRGKRLGSGKRLVLGLHGWLDNANTFDLLAQNFPDTITLLSLDLPGHGLSDHFPPGYIYDPRGYVCAVKKAVTKLGWTKFTYLGHSMGAVVGIWYCAIFPEDVDAFITIDIIKANSKPIESYASSYKRYILNYIDNERKCELPPIVYSEEDLVKRTIAGSDSLDEASAKIILQRGARMSDDGKGYVLTRDLRAKTYFIGFMVFDAWAEMAKRITCPILVIKAKNGHVYSTPEETEIMLNSFRQDSPHFVFKDMEGRHHLHLTHSQEVSLVVNQFFEDTQKFCSQE